MTPARGRRSPQAQGDPLGLRAAVEGRRVLGGVHGLERIGADVVTAYLRSLVMRLSWDDALHHQLEQVRIVIMPRVNPGGLWLGTRANPRGVDLMRNAPIEATESVPFMVGGQRLSAEMPWYRGPANAPMEVESAALCHAVERELQPRPFSLTVDCHSGFGLQDRLWFPYAHTARPIPHLAEVHALLGGLEGKVASVVAELPHELRTSGEHPRGGAEAQPREALEQPGDEVLIRLRFRHTWSCYA